MRRGHVDIVKRPRPLEAAWLIQTPHSLTAAQIDTAQKMAASAGLSVAITSVQKSLAALRNWSTAAGIVVALGVPAVAVGLIRSETANDLRTLTASGASSATTRAITGTTAGAYVALLAWHRSNLRPLTHIPIISLRIIIVVLPVIATTAGWLPAGNEPPATARQPLE